MADIQEQTNFPEQLAQTRGDIRHSFQRSHEALQTREDTLLSRIDQIESEYLAKTEELEGLFEALDKTKSFSSTTLTARKLMITRDGVMKLFDSRISELKESTDSSIEFEWDSLFETDIEQLGSIKLNGQTNISPTRTFSPQVKPVVPDYKAKQLPTAYCCKKSTEQKAPGEFNVSKGIAVHYKTGHIYIADQNNHRVQVFGSNGDYLHKFDEKMNSPRGICITQDRVYVTQCSGHCVNLYELEGKLIHSVGIHGCGEAQFSSPHGLDVSDGTNNVYVCDCNNNRVQIFTKNLKFQCMLGIGVFSYPRDVKCTRDRVLVLDQSNPCIFVFDTDHVLIKRLITRGNGKQVNNPNCFDIDRVYNIIISDYNNHCVYVFSEDGKQIHKIGKNGQGIGELIYPWGIALDGSGRIIVICQKDMARLQFF